MKAFMKRDEKYTLVILLFISQQWAGVLNRTFSISSSKSVLWSQKGFKMRPENVKLPFRKKFLNVFSFL